MTRRMRARAALERFVSGGRRASFSAGAACASEGAPGPFDQAEAARAPEPDAGPGGAAGPAAAGVEEEEALHALARRLYPKVDWGRMSEPAVRRALGQRESGCPQRDEYEAGRQARAAGEASDSTATMAFRIGWSHGRPPRRRRRPWRARPKGQGRSEREKQT